ncbi:hypothetical protein N7456_010489 [Penicillium angulare]|uniref:Uncharacterized protein n=1 Tax=Penicillium angulare TaxID=116970 RepID=A0A9W9F6Q4_9EURO|nr:hypothetical protein N7456_010489 [Penicillium angulare]
MALPPTNQPTLPPQHPPQSPEESESHVAWASAFEQLSHNLEHSFRMLRREDCTCNFAFGELGTQLGPWEIMIRDSMSRFTNGDARSGPVAIQQNTESTGASPPNWMQTLARIHGGNFELSEGDDLADYYHGSVKGFLVKLSKPQWDALSPFLARKVFPTILKAVREEEIEALSQERDVVQEHRRQVLAWLDLYIKEVEAKCMKLNGTPEQGKKVPACADQSMPDLSSEKSDIRTVIDNGISADASCGVLSQGTLFQSLVNVQPSRQLSTEHLCHTPESMQGQTTQTAMDSVLSTEDSDMSCLQETPTEALPCEPNTLSATQNLPFHGHHLQRQIPSPSATDQSSVSSTGALHDAITFAVPALPLRRVQRLSTPCSNRKSPLKRQGEELDHGIAFLKNSRNRGLRWGEIRLLWRERFGVWRNVPVLKNFHRREAMRERLNAIRVRSDATRMTSDNGSGYMIFKIPKTKLSEMEAENRLPVMT